MISLSFTVKERDPELREEERDSTPSEEETERALVRDDALSREVDRGFCCEARAPLLGDVALGMKGRRSDEFRGNTGRHTKLGLEGCFSSEEVGDGLDLELELMGTRNFPANPPSHLDWDTVGKVSAHHRRYIRWAAMEVEQCSA